MRWGAAALLCALAAGCGDPPEVVQERRSESYATATVDPGVPEGPPALRYVDVTAESGVDFVHHTGAYGGVLLPETMGSGCAFFDPDGDGDCDLLLLNGDAWPGHEGEGPRPTSRLYRNDGGFRFTDVTAQWGLAESFYAMGAAVADTDGDGDEDLFVTGVGGYRLYLNEGGRFRRADVEAGLDPGTWTDATGAAHGPFATSACFVDHDGDGLPDLFVCHYVHWSVETDIHATYDGKTKGYATPRQYQGETCRMWRNLGGNRFEDVTDAAGLRNDEGKSLGVCVVDLGDDGLPDLFVSNDTQPDYLYVNQGGGRFVDAGLRMGVAYGPDGTVRAGMGVGSTVVDGRLVLAVGNFSREPVSLWEQRGKVFVNRSDVSGVGRATLHPLTFGLLFLDADLDGRDDLLLANGHIEPSIGDVESDNSYAQPMQLLLGREGGRFSDVSGQLGADFTRAAVGRGLAAADLDGDGDLDLCATACGGPVRLLRCDLPGSAGRSLRIRVAGAPPVRHALGARVSVEAGGRTVVRWVRSGGSYLSESESTLTFGLGEHGRADRVTVRWPGGGEKVLESVGPGELTISR